MNLETIQDHIENNRTAQFGGGLNIEEWVELYREHFEASKKLAERKGSVYVPFMVDLSYEADRIWFEWMTEVVGYVALHLLICTKPGTKVKLARVTKERSTDEAYQTFKLFQFFPKGTTKKMIEQLYTNVESVEW